MIRKMIILKSFIKKVLLQTKNKFLTCYRVVSRTLSKKRDNMRRKAIDSLELSKKLLSEVEWVKVNLDTLDDKGKSEYKISKLRGLIVTALFSVILKEITVEVVDFFRSLGEFIASPNTQLILAVGLNAKQLSRRLTSIIVMFGLIGVAVYLFNTMKKIILRVLNTDLVMVSLFCVLVLVLIDLVLVGFNTFMKLFLFLLG